MGLNLFVVYPSIVLEYCRYKTLFNSYQSDYLIQERHYNTNPIKNYLFKNSGGIATTSIQKNLIENDHLFYYIDIDYMFTLGQITIDIIYRKHERN